MRHVPPVKRLFPRCLPGFGKTGRPVTETAAQAVLEQRAPTGGIAVTFTCSGEAVQLARHDHSGRFQTGGPDRILKLGECAIHWVALPSVHRLAAGLDLLVQPVVHLRLDPADGAAAKRNGVWKTTLGNTQIDRAAREPGKGQDGGEPQDRCNRIHLCLLGA